MQTGVRTTNETLGLEFNQSRYLHLDDLIPWFENDYKIYELINDFWGLETNSRLVAVSRDVDDKAWKGLVAEWDSDTRANGQIRINKNLIKGLLEISLGKRKEELNLDGQPKDFRLKDITQLEMSMFENFFIELENFWRDYWRVGMPNAHGNFTYLIWVVELDNQEIGSIAIGLPPGIVPKSVSQPIADYDFRGLASQLSIEVPLDLTIGKSKLKISEVRELEPGDLLVLEDSNLNNIIWKKNDLEKLSINITVPGKDNPDSASMYYDGLEMVGMIDENNNDDILTDLPVELTAQFKSVQMPLQKIIELESGGILPLGLLMDSQLTLVAPGEKAIASGNLVIVGNQFGIKINKTKLKGNFPKAKLDPKAIAGGERSEVPSQQTPAQAMPQMDPMMQEPQQQAAPNLDQDLEDLGIDPKELDELEDLY
ncbi:MAG: FliM/FliN family flagellar motor switch protein [Candidatus Melainabacteria bacterium]|nr:FliM/FliN family flagellar motor switch protein [Candidatus Melainabacteria bacterium]